MIIIYLIRIFFIALLTMFVGVSYFLFIWLDLLTNHLVYEVLSKLWGHGVLFISGIKVHMEGFENFDKNKNYVIAGNHLSLMDVPPIIAYFPGRLRYVFKKELGNIPFFGWMINVIHISIDRKNSRASRRSLNEARKKLQKGTSVIIFPEGTRSEDGEVKNFKKGGFIFAINNKLDILPYVIYGTREILHPDSKFINSGHVFIKFCKPIKIDDYEYNTRQKLVNVTRDLIISEYEKIKNKYKDRIKQH